MLEKEAAKFKDAAPKIKKLMKEMIELLDELTDKPEPKDWDELTLGKDFKKYRKLHSEIIRQFDTLLFASLDIVGFFVGKNKKEESE